MKSFLLSLSPAARIGMVVGSAVIVAGTLTVALNLGGPRFDVLFNDLRQADAAAISEQLDAWKVPFEIHDDGRTLTVPGEQVHATRLRLVSAGIPTGGRVGFELFKDSNFGVTEFAQKVNFQRALQGELERTIAAFDAVEHVRVHLNLNEARGLLARDQPNTASVALTLRPDAQLTAAQVSGIRNLVASSVEGLQSESVVVLDETGTSLVESDEDVASSITERLTDQAHIERLIHSRIATMMGRVFSLNDVSIAVDVQLNLDRVSVEKEQIRPQGSNGAGLVVRERRDGQRTEALPANGEPGPPRTVQSEVEYQHGREREQVIPAPGRIERLSIAVVVPATVDEETVAKLRTVIAAAAGLQPDRGDTIEVAALIAPRLADVEREEFSSPLVEPASIAASQSTPSAAPSIGSWLVLVVAISALSAGLLLGRVSRRRHRLTQAEREAGMVQIRAWLALESAR